MDHQHGIRNGLEVVDRYWSAFDRRDAEEMRHIAHDDLITEWPQSGESIYGAENCVLVLQHYPGGPPSRTAGRTTGCGDVWVTESALAYPERGPVHFVTIFKLRDDRIARITEYFAEPFEAPEWRIKLMGQAFSSRSSEGANGPAAT